MWTFSFCSNARSFDRPTVAKPGEKIKVSIFIRSKGADAFRPALAAGGSLMAYKCLSLCDFFIVQHFFKLCNICFVLFENLRGLHFHIGIIRHLGEILHQEMQNRKKCDAFNLSATFIGCVCEFPQVSMTKMILRIKLPLTMLKAIANALQERVVSNYRFVLSFNSALILLGALGILPPATSAMLHNLSTLGISLRSMTDLLEQKHSL